MAASDYTPSGTFPDLDGTSTGPLQLPADGDVYTYDVHYDSASPKHGLFGKLIDACDYLKKNAGSSAVAAYTGTMFTIAAGSLQTYLRLLADKAAKLDAAVNDFTSRVDIGTDCNIGQDCTIGGALDVAGTTTMENAIAHDGVSIGNGSFTAAPLAIGRGAYVTRTAVALGTGVTTATIDAGYPLWLADGWVGGGGADTLDVTISNYAGSDNPEIRVVFYPINSGSIITFTRQGGGATFLEITAKGSVDLRWSGTSWRIVSATTFTATAANLSFVGAP